MDLIGWSRIVNPSEIRELGDVRPVTKKDATGRRLGFLAKSVPNDRQKFASRHAWRVCLGFFVSAMGGKRTWD